MIFRLATKQDLFQIKNMYLNIVNKMTENNIFIWDSTYPCEFLENDIDNHALYILLKGSEILAARIQEKPFSAQPLSHCH